MFGVGENPIYLERVAAREERRRRSGQAQAAEEAQRRQDVILEGLMSAPPDAANGGQGEAAEGASSPASVLSSTVISAPTGPLLVEGAPSDPEEPEQTASGTDEAQASEEPLGVDGRSLDAKLDALFVTPTLYDDDDDMEPPPLSG